MSFKYQKRLPLGPLNPSNVLHIPPLDEAPALVKRRKINAAAAGSENGTSEAGVEFKSREDVEKLLNERIRAKKNDFKGKSEDAMLLLRKFRCCVSWQMDLVDRYKMEVEKLNDMLESESTKHTEAESLFTKKTEELDSIIVSLRREYAMLQERFNKEETDRLAMTKSYEEERDATVAAQNSLTAVSEELERTSKEAKHANDHTKVLRESNKVLQEYNTSLKEYISKFEAEAVKYKETITKLQEEKNTMTELVHSLKRYKASEQKAVKQKEELKNEVDCLKSELEQVRDDRDHQLRQVQRLTADVASYKELSGKSSTDSYNLMRKTSELEVTSSSQREQIQTLEHQLAAANEKLKREDLTTIEALAEYEDKKKMISDLQNRLADAEIQIFEADKLCKQQRNTILELKGNIRVFCRVRPVLSDSDCNSTEGAIVSYPTSTEALGRGIDLMHLGQKRSFTFDKVFTHEASQEDVFVEISSLVQSAIDGKKVCIFTYGQTGSGKTYTMMGKPEATEQMGLIPRSLEQIFQSSQSLQSRGWKYKMQASMLEIYNETIHDLLSPGRQGTLDASVALNKQYTIKHDSNGNTNVSDLTIVNVCSINEVSFLLQQAARSRSVGKTQMNEQSSRSHFVFTLRITGVNENMAQQVQGVLNLIDLAGSERLNKSGSTGERLKETQAINKSLSALTDVIFAIANKEDHVPFRNSKLTYLLQPCLGGDSKTLMFVNVSPESSSAGESICSLRFAARVNSCEIGVPRRHSQAQARFVDARLSYG